MGVDKPPIPCYNKGTKREENKTMYFYEIRNTKTQETAQVTSKNFATACRSIGWRPYDCKCVWKANAENACDPANY